MVTIAAFALPAWICGALILRPFVDDLGVRWGLAGALGVAVAALAALWGHSFAKSAKSRELDPVDVQGPAPAAGTVSGSTHNEISDGTFHGPVLQSGNISGSDLSQSYSIPEPQKGKGDE
jgi:hypothetical protein